MNKKTYIKPTIEVAVLAPEAMLSSSISINDDQTVDTSKEGTQLGQGHRGGSWGDLWE